MGKENGGFASGSWTKGARNRHLVRMMVGGRTTVGAEVVSVHYTVVVPILA